MLTDDTAPQAEALAYSIVESCRRDSTGRSTKYKALNPDPGKRDGLPFLPSFRVGRRRLILAADHQAWLAKLREASLSAELPHQAVAAPRTIVTKLIRGPTVTDRALSRPPRDA